MNQDWNKVEKAGLKVEQKQTTEFEVAEEFQRKLDKSAALRKAFNALTPDRQRAYHSADSWWYGIERPVAG